MRTHLFVWAYNLLFASTDVLTALQFKRVHKYL